MGFPVVIVATVGNEAEIALKWEINCRLKMKYFVKLQQGIRKKETNHLTNNYPETILQPTCTSTGNPAHQFHVIVVNDIDSQAEY